jgi:hypothetical protein
MKIHGNKIVYIIEPECHGNGGWCGYRTVVKMRYSEFKNGFNPYEKYEMNYRPSDYYDFGDIRPRASLNENPNDAFSIFCVDDYCWDSKI